ncbi:type VI secretion system baseplate subunit TssF [Silvibacterium acidisoli]|uniref:type VI secretion system baseplate subunit TssF n=1 Tax=Acidobacteriaceae bacterium ZG23-2 TaxID=2883246 RepID=UPI00406D0A56
MRSGLLQNYERELGYMRQLGAEFAAKYPAVAGRLLLEPDRCADPHVERLIESFAFLAARIHLRLDDDFPELTQGFMDVVYPAYLRPQPSMTVVEFQPDAASGGNGTVTVPRGSELLSKHEAEGIACTFKTSYPVTLWPLSVRQCSWRRPEQVPVTARVRDAAAVLQVELATTQGAKLSALDLDDLVFYLSGDRLIALTLYEMLSRNLLQVVVRNSLEQHGQHYTLERHNLLPVGFAEGESLLPSDPRSFQGQRLIQEYFSFPEKFLFFRLNGLRAAIEAVGASTSLEIIFFMCQPEHPERLQSLESGVSTETMRLYCTPAVNLFHQVAEPIVVTQTRTEYPVTVDARSRGNTEVFSVESVLATNPSRRTASAIPPLFQHRFQESATDPVYWKATRRYSDVHPEKPGRMFLSIADQDGTMLQPDAEILTVHCTCTNHDLPSMLSVGSKDGDFHPPVPAGIGSVRALHRPTRSFPVPAREAETWSLISQLSLNHLSIGEKGLPALQEILRLHNFARAPHLEKQIAGILELRGSRQIAILQTEAGGGAVRGMRLEMELDESHFTGGGAYLFAAVMDRFFGLYVSMNSFSQLAVRTTSRKEVLEEWPPRAGTQMLL